MTDDLAAMTAFAEARLAEDEAAAKAAFGKTGRWCRASDVDTEQTGVPSGALIEGGRVVVYDESAPTDAEFDHIARQDPDSTLAGVASARLLLAVIQAMPHDYIDGDTWYSCSQAADPHPDDDDDTGPGSGCLDEDRAGKPCDCGRDPRARRMLAAIVMRWAGHRDYLEGWKP